MFTLKTDDPNTSKFFQDGHFSVNKNAVPFSALGTDHALEQENKRMKILGGITGIANNATTLNNYFLVSPILNNIANSFCQMFCNTKTVCQTHYQMHGSTNKRYTDNISKLTQVLQNHNVSFENNEDLYNLVSKVVLPAHFADKLIGSEKIGYELYSKFKTDRLQGETSIWKPLVKTKLPTFAKALASTEMKIADTVVRLKEEKQLLTKFIIAARSRDDIDLPGYFGNHEFSVVSLSMFRRDGSLLLGTDKSLLMNQMTQNIAISDLRWFLFSKYQWESDKLPPNYHQLQQQCILKFYGHTLSVEYGSSPVTQSCHCQM